MKVNTKKLAVPLAAVIAFAGGAAATVAAAANAQTTTTGTTQSAPANHRGPMGVSGTVTAVNGSTITLTGTDGKTYTITAGSASIDKVSTITTADIAAGDTLRVGGTISGTNVTAEHITDGTLPAGGFGDDRGPGKMPGVFGTVSAVSGNTLTVAGKDGTTYTVDASSAKVMKGSAGSAPASSTVSAIATGDTVMIMGTVSGTNVTATNIMDGVTGPHFGDDHNTQADTETTGS